MPSKSTQVFIDFKSILDAELERAGITGWLVVQNFNPVQGHWSKPTLVMHRVRADQYGAVGQHYTIEGDALMLETSESREVTLQIDAICPRDLAQQSNWEAPDVIAFLRHFFSGPFGVAALKEKGYSLAEKIRTIDEPAFLDEHETYEYNPNMQIKLFYVDVQKREVPALTAVELKNIKGV